MAPPASALILSLAASAAAARAGQQAVTSTGSASSQLWMDPTKGVEERLAALLPTLSVEQLAAQTEHLWTTVSMAKILANYSKTGVGASYIAHPTGNGTCDSDPACNLASRLAANRALMKSCGIPLTFVAETLHSPWISQGVVMPMPVTMGASWNTSLLTEIGRAIAREATACGVTRGFSPEINVCTDPRFGRTQENFGSDAHHVAECGASIATGLGGAGSAHSPSEYVGDGSVSTEAKHLAAYGSGEMDGAPADVSPMTLHDIYLKPWKKFFRVGGRGAMLSHNSVNGIPAHMHKEIMTKIIRTEWNHSNVFFASDYHDIDAIMGFKMASTLQDAGVMAAEAGMDQALGGSAFTYLADAVNSGKMPRSMLERAASGILREKFAVKMFDKQFDGVSDGNWGNLQQCRAHAAGGILDNPTHRALAKRAAAEGAVLLKNGHVLEHNQEQDTTQQPAAACRFSNNSDCYGDGLPGTTPAPTATDADCCILCQKTPGCRVAVWLPAGDSKPPQPDDKHRCMLKAACSDPRPTQNRVRCDLPGVDPGSLRFGTLPLTPKKWSAIKQIAIVGPNADNGQMNAGSYVKVGTELTTFLAAAPNYVPKTTKVVSAALNATLLIDGGQRTPNSGGDPAANDHNPKIPGGINMNLLSPQQRQAIDEAVAAANASDLTIALLGDSPATCGEGTDRISLDLPGVQMQLLGALAALGKPLMVILVHGRPVTFGPSNAVLDKVDVLLASWIGGEAAGPALWEIINGEFNPSGRLAQTWPRSVGYVGSHADSKFGPEGLWQGDYIGMGWRDGEMNGPLFEYGFGLSYGGVDTFTFMKEDLTASVSDLSFDVHVNIKSTAAPGGTVVQLYFSQAVAQAVRPKLMLLAFAKIERSTTTNVTLTIPVEELGYYHPLTQTTNVDAGLYTLHLGTSSAKLQAQATLTLKH